MSSHRARDHVFTLFGDYLRERAAAVWTGSLIELLRPLGLSEGATRTVLSRMSARGWLESKRVGRRSYYALTARGRKLLREGADRIHHPPRADPWDGLWYLVAYSIPESRRQLRDRLRVRLQWLGFGQLGNGMWISPYHMRSAVNEVATELGISDRIELFRGQYQGFSSVSQLVSQAWDLERIDARYAGFLERHVPACEEARKSLRDGALTPREAYLRRFELVHEYREFAAMDPYLPERLLPTGWKGQQAAELFEAYHDLLGEPAEAFVASVVEVTSLSPHREHAGGE
jgi:phenylacetic acid degradation operon negative regulatory protein